MVKTCSFLHCRTGYKRKNGDGGEITKFPVFGFPNDKKYLNDKWIKVVNRKDWLPTNYVGICSRHFVATYLKVGKRTTLKCKNKNKLTLKIKIIIIIIKCIIVIY